MNCSILNEANKKESILFPKLLDILGSESLAYKAYTHLINNEFSEDFGDWVSEYNSETKTQISERMDGNGEPTIHKKKGTNQWYFKGISDNIFLNKIKFAEIEEKDVREVTDQLVYDYITDLGKRSLNDVEPGQLLLSDIEKSIEKSISQYKYSLNESDELLLSNANLVLKYKDDFAKEMIDKMSSIGFDIKKIKKDTTLIDQEDIEENDKTSALNIAESFESNSKDSATSNTKLFLSGIVDIKLNKKNNKYESQAGDFLRKNKFTSFEDVWSTLEPLLSDVVGTGHGNNVVDVFTLMMIEVEKLNHIKPWSFDLYNKLKVLREQNNDKTTEFIQAFSKTKLNFYVTEYSDKSYKVINATSTNSRESKIVSQWGSNFLDKFQIQSGALSQISKDKLKGLKENIGDTLLAFNSRYSTSRQEKNEEDRNSLGLEVVYDYVDEFQQLASKIGIEVSNEQIEILVNMNGGDKHAYREVHNLYKKTLNVVDLMLDDTKPLMVNGEFKNPFSTESGIKMLARAVGVTETDISENTVLLNDGKMGWAYASPSYLSNKVNEWKADPSSLVALSLLPYNRNSKWINHLLATDIKNKDRRKEESKSRIDALQLGLASSFKSKGKNDGNDNKDIKYPDAINENIVKLLGGRVFKGKSYHPTLIPADKMRRIEMEGFDYIDAKIDMNGSSFLIHPDTVDILVGYFEDEYSRMKSVSNDINNLEDNKKIVHYHTGNTNGLKSQLFPSLSHDSKNISKELRDKLYDEDGHPLDTNILGLSKAQKEAISIVIKKDIEVMVKKTHKELGLIENKSKEILDSYSVNENPSMAMAGDYFINGLIASVEYTKLFSGDPAYYKNTNDLIKRIPATYTDGLQLRIQDSDHLIFNQATVEGVEVASKYLDIIEKSLKDKKLANPYKEINTTDAQAWITPNRWRFLKKRLGQWSPLHDSAFDSMLKGKELSTAELKVAAQPLKGVYFEINDGRPVYLKYSQAVIMPGMVKGTAMEALLNKMTKDKDGKDLSPTEEIHEVITIDGIKVGAVAPTRINVDGTSDLLPAFDLNPVMLTNRGWKLQQDLPTKNIKSTRVGSQVQKTILSNINLESDNYTFEGKPISGQNLFEKINNVISDLSNLGKNKLKNKFGIGDDNIISDKTKLYEALIDEFKGRGASDNIISALEKELSFDEIPQIRKKLPSIFMSMMNKDIVKITTNGGSMIQVAPFGYQQLTDSQVEYIEPSESAYESQNNSGEFKLNEGQEKAKKEVLDFLKSDNPSMTHSLIGYAGTGKTTVLKEIFDEFISKNRFQTVVFSSPTHKANAVIKQKNEDYDVKTIHSLLGLRGDQSLEEFDVNDMKFIPQGAPDKPGVLVIDESSMINDSLFEMIKSSLPNTKILFVGDEAQIQPVKQATKSKALTSTDKTSSLTQVMRAENNEVLEESMSVRANGDFSYTNKTKQGVEFLNKEVDFLTKSFEMINSKEFENNPLYARILTGTNARADNLNKRLHKALFPEATDKFAVGTVLMGFSNWGVDYKTKQPKIQNSGDYKVTKRSENQKRNIEGVEVEGINVTIKSLIDPKSREKVIFMVNEDSDLKGLGAKHEELRRAALGQKGRKAAQAWGRLAEFKDSFGLPESVLYNGRTVLKKTLDLGYAHTTHKSQGSTYENVFIDSNDISKGFGFRNKELESQLKYVAVTRASKKSYVLTSKKITQEDVPAYSDQVELDKKLEPKDNSKKSDKKVLNKTKGLKSGIRVLSNDFDTKTGLKPPRIENGIVKPGQCLMPYSKLKSILKSNGHNINDYTDTELMELIDPSALQIITYRIPNQGMSSNDSMEIVGILPDGMGDSIIAYDAIPGKTGSDFDIDKMFLMMHHLEFSNGKVRKIKPDSTTEKGLQNQLIDLYHSILTSTETYDDMMTSIDGSFLQDDLAGNSKKGIKGLFPVEEMGNLELFSPVQQMKTKFAYLSGKFGVAQTANHLVDHVLNQTQDIRFVQGLGIGHETEGMTMFDEMKDTNNKHNIGHTLSAFLNAYVDIAKDPYISRGNHNGTTAGVTFMLLRAGVPIKWVNRFVAQPSIVELVRLTNSSEGLTSERLMVDKEFKTPYDVVRSKLNSDKKDFNKKMLNDMTEESMELAVGSDIENMTPEQKKFQAKVLDVFQSYQGKGKLFNDMLKASKADANGGGGSFVDRTILSNKFDEVFESNEISGFSDKFKGTALGTFKFNSIDWVGEVIQNSNLLITSGDDFENTMNTVSAKLGKGSKITDPELAKTIEGAYYTYAMSGTNIFKDNYKQITELFVELPEIIRQLKLTLDNKFIDELQIEKSGEFNYLKIDSKNKPTLYHNQMYRSWLNLYTDPTTKDVAVALAKYSFSQSGFQNNLTQFFSYMPHEILSDHRMKWNMKIVADQMSESDIDSVFREQLIRNNYKDNVLVPNISLSNTSVVKGSYTGAGFIYESDNISTGIDLLGQESYPEFLKTVVNKYAISEAERRGLTLKEELGLFRLAGYVMIENKEDMMYDRKPLYVRTFKLGTKSNKGSVVEYSFDNRINSGILGNNVSKKDSRQISLMIKEAKDNLNFEENNVSFDPSYKEELKEEVAGLTVISKEDVMLFNNYVKKAGVLPDAFFTNNTFLPEFYNDSTGKKEPIPQDHEWKKNSEERYDLINMDSGEMIVENVDLSTGVQFNSVPLENLTSGNPLLEAGILPTDMDGTAENDIYMSATANQFIGNQKYRDAWGNRANTEEYSKEDVIMVSGTSLFEGVPYNQINEEFENFYVPLLDKAIEAESSFLVGNGEGTDMLVDDYLVVKAKLEKVDMNGYHLYSKKQC